MAKVPIPTDWDGESYCCRIIAWPDSEQWTAILLGLITWPQKGRFWDERTGTVTEAQSVGEDIYNRNVLESECILGCIDEINASLAEIAAAIGSGGGSDCGSGGAGSTEPPAIDEEYDPPGTEGGVPPPGFDTFAEYETYKCDVATWILDNALDDVQVMQVVNLLAASALVFAGLLVSPVPGSRVAALLVAVITLYELEGDALQTWEDVYSNHNDDLLCALYSSDSATGAKADFIAAFETAVDSETADVIERFAIKQANKLLIGNNLFNKLFDKDEFTQFPTGDCSACADICTSSMNYGTGDPDSSGVYTSEEITPTQHRIGILWDSARDISVSLSGHTPYTGGTVDFRISSEAPESCGGSLPYGYDILEADSWTFPDDFSNCRILQFQSGSSFTATITYS